MPLHIADWVWHWAEKTPDAIAISSAERSLSYRGLVLEADHLAVRLKAAGVGPESLVALSFPRSVDLVVGLVAILRAGGAYLPIEPNLPADRIGFLLEDSGAILALTESALAPLFAAVPLVIADYAASDPRISANVSGVAPADPLAYVIYTSGSTGRPKGVAVTQGNLTRLFEQTNPWFGFSDQDVWTLYHSFAFDFSVWEIWGALRYGGRLVVVSHEVARDPLAFRALVSAERVTVLNQTPSAFRLFDRADAVLPDLSLPLRYVIFGGEALDLRSLQGWFQRHGDTTPRLINMYGITETTVHVTYRPLTRMDAEDPRSLIGEPIPDLTLSVHDADGNAATEGELWVGGPGVARGYLRRPELTSQKFVNGRYRTGDLVRVCVDGELAYLGRIDSQVKLRGFRIELGEIESILRQASGVADAAVALHTPPETDPVLIGFLVPTEHVPTSHELTAYLLHKLPAYMCPQAFVFVDTLPLTNNGKLDRSALPFPTTASFAPDSDATDAVARIAGLYRELFPGEPIDADTNFFALGGTSLQAMLLVLRIAERFGVVLPAGSVFRNPEVAALAAVLEQPVKTIPSPRPAEAVISPSQEQMLFAHRLHPDSDAFHCAVTFRIRGELDVSRLTGAIHRAAMRHPALRTTFSTVDGKAFCAVRSEPVFTLKQSTESVRDVISRPFDLTSSCGRACLLPDGQFILVLHHIITDGWSLDLLLREIATDYNGGVVPEPRAFHSAMQNEVASAAFWRQTLADALPVTTFAPEKIRPSTSLFRSAHLAFALPTELSGRLLWRARQERCTPNALLLGTLAALLSRYTEQRDLVIGLTYAGRDTLESQRAQGLLMNLLPVRLQLPAGATLRDLLQETRQKCEAAFEHGDFPFARIVQETAPVREANRQPLAQVLFAPQPSQHGRLALEGLEVEEIPARPASIPYDLVVCSRQEATGIALEFVYAADLYSAGMMASLRDHFMQLLESALDEPDRPVTELRLLTPAESDLLFEQWSGRQLPPQVPLRGFLEILAEAVARNGTAIAVEQGPQTISYRELDAWSNRIAHALIGRGVERDRVVAISCERCPAAMAAILGIWKAGGAYLPLDPSYPAERRAWMLADGAAKLVVVTNEAVDGAECLAIDAAIDEYPSTAPHATPRLDDLAYLIYTSGSTGTPKGVMIEHRGLATLAGALRVTYPLLPGDRMLQYCSLSFDVCVAEIAFAFLQGATMVIPAQGGLLAGIELLDMLERERIAQVLLPASVLAQLPSRELPNLKRLVSGGENCPAALVERWGAGREFINAYGPTEASVGATAHLCVPGEGDPPIGRALLGSHVYVLDAEGRLVPPLVVGELHIGGTGLARGYFGRPELTAEHFIAGTPDVPERLYKTGDRVRWRRDGNLEFVGRNDGQLKIRGFRIELGEVEAALAVQPELQAVAALVDGEGPAARLVAYAVPRGKATAESILQSLRRRLPAQMVPSELYYLRALPVTPNGKLDRSALPKMAGAAPRQAPPIGVVAEIWRAVLGRSVGPRINFFDAGGTSLGLVEVQTRLVSATGVPLALADLFGNPTIQGMTALLGDEANAVAPPAPAQRAADEPIAIIGMASRFPQAPDLAAFWSLLVAGQEGLTRFSAEELITAGVPADLVRDPAYVPVRGVIAEDAGFDAALFGMAAGEAERLDPQQRIWLECALAALEDAGCDPRTTRASIGVFAGVGSPEYLSQWPAKPKDGRTPDYQLALGNEKDFVATRTAYKLGLRGPSINLQTACSTSLVAVHVGCQQLLLGECDIAVAGAASLSVPSKAGYLFQEGMILSPDGHCRPFDRQARGTVTGDGAGAVVLKRLSDAIANGDDIYAVIAGGAMNNDGNDKVGFTAPSVSGQRDVIHKALRRAGLEARDVSYVEAHGTGTLMGDPIEFSALSQVFVQDGAERGKCTLSSVKGNIGHLNTAAGVAGLIKAVLAIRHRTLPGTMHFAQPNPKIDLTASPFAITSELRPWDAEGRPLVAGISSFGFGGTNVHLIVAEPPVIPAPQVKAGFELLPISAHTPTAFAAAAAQIAGAVLPALHSVARTLQAGRTARPYRGFAVAADVAQATARCSALRPSLSLEAPSVGLLFPGQGSESAANVLLLASAEPRVREELESVDAVLRSATGVSLLDLLATSTSNPDTSLTQPMLFGVEYALARVLMTAGVAPSGLLGHSLGEYVAACLAGVFTLPEALVLVTARGRAMQATDPGAMLSVAMPEAQLLLLLPEDLDLAAVNGPSQCIVSGSLSAITNFEAMHGHSCRRLGTERAFHSRLMDPALPVYRRAVEAVKLQTPKLPFVSSVTGDWITDAEATSSSYWVEQIRRPVRFFDALSTILAQVQVLMEAGPGDTLTVLANRHPEKKAQIVLSTLGRERDGAREQERWLRSLGHAWCAGVSLDWNRLRDYTNVRMAHLPTYPFERQRYWVPGTAPVKAKPAANWIHIPVWMDAQAAAKAAPHTCRILLADRRGIAVALADERTVVVHAGETFSHQSAREFTVDPARRADFDRLFSALAGEPVDDIVHAFPLDAETALEGLDGSIAHSYDSTVYLVQALAHSGIRRPRLTLLTAGAREANPLAAAVAGLMRVVPIENEGWQCRHIDLDHTALDVTALARELENSFDSPSIALRNGRRLHVVYEPAPPPADSGRPLLKKDGVYIVTGGLGGVGLALAEHLATHYRAHLVLASRTGREPGTETPESALRARMLERVRAAAGSVLLVAADVAVLDQARSLVSQTVNMHGRVDGVIHAAGVTGGGTMQLRSGALAARILRSKIHGTLALEAALAGVPHRFLFLCSSLTAVAGMFGQADYTAANAFLDSYAAMANTPERRVVSVNWDGWAEVGSYARHIAPKPVAFLEKHPWIATEHTVGGQAMLPGTVYAELACQTAQAQGWALPFTIRELTLLEPCLCDGMKPSDLITHARQDGENLEIRMESPGRVHALARLSRVAAPVPALDPAILRLDAELRSDTVLPAAGGFVAVGPRWQCVRWRQTIGSQSFGRSQLPAEYAAEAGSFVVHPALFDTLSHVVSGHRDKAYLPFSYSGLTLYRPLADAVLVVATDRSAGSARHIRMVIANLQGEVLAVAEDYSLRQAAVGQEVQ